MQTSLKQYVVHTSTGRAIVRSAEDLTDLYRVSNHYGDMIDWIEDSNEYKNRTGEDL